MGFCLKHQYLFPSPAKLFIYKQDHVHTVPVLTYRIEGNWWEKTLANLAIRYKFAKV